MNDQTVLASTRRRTIVEIVEREPGITLSQLVRQLSSGWGSVHLHVAKLEDAGLIVRHRLGRRVMLFPAGGGVPAGMNMLAVLQGRTARRIAAAVAQGRGATVAELSEELDVTVRITYYHVKRLIAAGLVASGSSSRHIKLAATERLREALQAFPEGTD